MKKKVLVVNKKAKKKLTGKAREKAIEEFFAWCDKHGVDMSNFKFDREEANSR
jgi:hypothetical protein